MKPVSQEVEKFPTAQGDGEVPADARERVANLLMRWTKQNKPECLGLADEVLRVLSTSTVAQPVEPPTDDQIMDAIAEICERVTAPSISDQAQRAAERLTRNGYIDGRWMCGTLNLPDPIKAVAAIIEAEFHQVGEKPNE